MGRGHPDHGLVEAVAAGRAVEGRVAVAEDATVGRGQVVAVARDGAQRDGLGPVGAGDLQRGGEDAEGRGREGDREVAGRARRKVAVRAAELEDPVPSAQARRDVHAFARRPQLDRRALRSAPRQYRGVDAVGVDADGQQRHLLGPGEVGRVHGVTPDEHLGGRGPVAHAHQGGRLVLPQNDVAVAPAAAPTRGRAGRVGPARAVVVHPHGQRRHEGGRGGIVGATPVGVGREARITLGVGARLGVGVQVGGEARNGCEAPIDPLEVGQDEELLGRGQRGPVAGQAHGAQPLHLAVAVEGGQPAGAVGAGRRHAAAGARVAGRRRDVPTGVLGRNDGCTCPFTARRWEEQDGYSERRADGGLSDN